VQKVVEIPSLLFLVRAFACCNKRLDHGQMSSHSNEHVKRLVRESFEGIITCMGFFRRSLCDLVDDLDSFLMQRSIQ